MPKKYLLALVALSFILALYFNGVLPERIAVHWNAEGNADGFSEKGFGLFLVPLISLGIVGIFIFLLRLDPWQRIFRNMAPRCSSSGRCFSDLWFMCSC